MAGEEILEIGGRDVRITNPDKMFFPEIGVTKIGLVRYWLDVAPGALTGCRDRPTLLKRHPNGVDGDFFYQKRVPDRRPEWIETVKVTFPSGRTADFLVMRDAAHLAWAINLGCLELHPWPVRASDTDHPDELRIDVDPTPEASFDDVRRTALLVREVLADHGLDGFPKTSGKRGIHVNVRIEPRWDFTEVRRAALALGREAERRDPMLITTAWWKEQRHGVFIDYNQNARDRTVASAYSVRPTPDGRVSCPLDWSEVADVEPGDLTILTVPERFKTRGDPGAGIDERAYTLDGLLDLAARDEREGLGDAPWPPNFPKAPGEPRRVAPSRAKKKRVT
ncbi:MAG TPA: DNA polymerase domain-containing protein [Actinomycetota bacterium]